MRKWFIVIVIVALFLGGVLATGSRWDGDITEAATTPLAEEKGVEEAQLLPWTIEGDLLLFVFLIGGGAAGFAAGYYWHKLFLEGGAGDGSTSTGSGKVERGIT